MSGYIQIISCKRNSKSDSPVLGLFTFGKEAREAYDTKLRSLKSAGCKFEAEPVEYERVPYEQSGKDRQVLVRAEGVDREGNEVVLLLERFHVGGGAAKRGINAGGPTVKAPKKASKKSKARKATKVEEPAAS